MGSFRQKDGTRVVTNAVYDKAMNKRGISKLVHIIPEHPAHESRTFARALAAYFWPALQDALARTNDATAEPPSRRPDE